jgi:hypothetical protein
MDFVAMDHVDNDVAMRWWWWFCCHELWML